jgi:hypothetical protein
MLENGYSQRLKHWLDRFGFTADPFAVYEADQERAVIPYIFVDRPYVHHVVGDPARPQSAFLLARTGEGKTATREIVLYECMHGRLRNRTLPVRYSDFDFLLAQAEGDPHRVTMRHHAAAIARATLQVLVHDVPPQYFAFLDAAGRDLLLAFAETFAQGYIQHMLTRLLPGKATGFSLDSSSPTEILALLVQLVQQLGPSKDRRYEALYVLIDRADETAAGVQAACSLLQPLIVDSLLPGIPGLALKCFLTRDLGDALLATVRRDRYYVETITWDSAALRSMIDQRLNYYSDNRIEHFGQLCTTAARSSALDRLINKSQASPRTLLRLCETLLSQQVIRTSDLFIDARDIAAILNAFEQKPGTTADITHYAPQAASADAAIAASQPPALQLDDSGHVWIDGVLLDPPLTALEFRLLHTLYVAAPDIVIFEDLFRRVWDPAWSSEMTLSTADDQNLRKLVARLRSKLDRTQEGKPRASIRNAHGRGYWLSKV